jgi:GNAT superfamily N-acetyltransferase
MLIRNYDRSDAIAITRPFYETVRSANLKDYSAEQVGAWAPEIPDPAIWHSRMSQRCTLVAEENDQVIAFAELEHDGHLDMFYCRREFIGRGVGRKLYQALETRALDLGLRRIFTDFSITARPFFERCGFSVVKRRTVRPRVIQMTNFGMEKQPLQ